MIFWWWSTRRSGWAASMPRRASTTTSFGSLMSFFMSVFSRVVAGGSGRGLRQGRVLGGGEIDPLGHGRVGWRVRDEPVGQRGDGARQELRGEVHRQLFPLHGASGDLLDEHRAEGAGRVDGGAGRRRDRDDRGED